MRARRSTTSPRAASCRSSPAAPACISTRCCDGLSPMPEADPAIRARDRRRGRASAAGRRCTPNWPRSIRTPAARIHATDAQRIQRALEVYRAVRPPDQRLAARRRRATACRCACSSWCWRRATARAARAHRAALRRDAGRGLPRRSARAARAAGTAGASAPLDLPALRAVGYRQAWEHLDGATDAGRIPRPRRSSPPASWPSASSPGCAASWMRAGSIRRPSATALEHGAGACSCRR